MEEEVEDIESHLEACGESMGGHQKASGRDLEASGGI